MATLTMPGVHQPHSNGILTRRNHSPAAIRKQKQQLQTTS